MELREAGLPRSAARTYWVRSLVPMLKKSTLRASCSMRTAAEGTSIMIPVELARHEPFFALEAA